MFERFFHIPTKETDQLTCIDLFAMNRSQRQEIKKMIAAHGGNIRVLVHPHFNDPSYITAQKEKQVFERYEKSRDRLYASDSDDQLPLFIFEERHCIQATIRAIQRSYTSNKTKTIVFVPTQISSSEPMPTSKDENNDMDASFYDKRFDAHWTKLRKIFKKLGVRKIIVNGQNMEISTKSSILDRDHIPLHEQLSNQGYKPFFFRQCAGTAAVYLAHSFDVEIGGIAFPHNRLFAAFFKS